MTAASPDPLEPRPRPSRRSFLARIWRGTGWGLVAGSGLLVGRVLSGVEARARRIAVSAEDLTRAVRDGGLARGELFLTGPTDAPHALHLRCTHLGCPLCHEPERGELACPCHGSRFDEAGRPLRGPAATPLRRLALRRVGEHWEASL